MIENSRRHLKWIPLAVILAAGVVGWLWISNEQVPIAAINSPESCQMEPAMVAIQQSKKPLPPTSQADGKTADDRDESPELLARVAEEVGKCRDLLNAIESAKVETVSNTENSLIIRLHSPTKEELDPVYTALTKAGDSFRTDSRAAIKFYDEASALINEYALYENPGRILMFNNKRSSDGGGLTVIEFPDAETSVSLGANGQLELTSASFNTQNKPDWKIPNSPTRLRYQHLFENP